MTKVNIREALNQMDKDTNCKYDLVTLYEGYNFNDEEKKEIAKMISDNEDAEVIYDRLSDKFGKDVDFDDDDISDIILDECDTTIDTEDYVDFETIDEDYRDELVNDLVKKAFTKEQAEYLVSHNEGRAEYLAYGNADNDDFEYYIKYIDKRLNEDTQLKLFDDDMIDDIAILQQWRPEEVEEILVKHGSNPNNDNWIAGLDLPAAYDEIMTTFRDKYSDYSEIDYGAAKVLGLVDESLNEGLSPQKGDRVRMDHYTKLNNGQEGTVTGRIGELCSVTWDDGTKSKEIKGYLTVIEREGKVVNESTTEIVEDNEETDDLISAEQEFDSAATSINSSKLPAVYNMVKFNPGDVVVDFGGGKFDNAVNYLKDQDVTLLVYDPYNRSAEHNKDVLRVLKEHGGADAAVNSNVLNVIKETEARNAVLQNIKKITKKGAPIYITVYEGTGKGNEGPTKSGYQLNRKTSDYMDEISQVFSNVKRKGKLITAINESVTDPRYYKMIEYTYDGDNASDYLGHVRVRTNSDKVALRAAEKYAMSKHPEDNPRHFKIVDDNYTNVDVVDSDGDYLTTLESIGESKSIKESSIGPKYVTRDIINKTNSQKLKDAYDEGELEVLINGDIWYTERCPKGLGKELKAEMKRLYPDIKYLYGESVKGELETRKQNYLKVEEDYSDEVDTLRRYLDVEVPDICREVLDLIEHLPSHKISYATKICRDFYTNMENIINNYTMTGDNLKESSYGGAFDIADDQYFTKEELVEFGEDVVDNLNSLAYSRAKLESIFIENNVIEITITWDGNEITVEQPIDMRRIRTPKDLGKYRVRVISKMKPKLEEVGFDFGPHLGEYELSESSYGGAYDIPDDAYFTKEDGMIAANEVAYQLEKEFPEAKLEVMDMQLDNHSFYVVLIDKDGNEFTEEITLDMRKIRHPLDLIKKYTPALTERFIKQIKDYYSEM